ncbi:hypothetical protein [Bradyrhizobium arachidis]|uniref:Uncharacterized protein n=1 Tax=Bradyrhizobium arachidis TaxID=858423 RepID=A0AAE7NPT3_9BRAD|nr:hypothetical protein [Bradyrhizobium arachidis]QOZ67293.1 hypothetical protein WN72_13960 [Bradyrhizobium arachidis]SFU79485.1 hypothetical protein SAMN05192541_1055 [Bradyrhizobium arachidis]
MADVTEQPECQLRLETAPKNSNIVNTGHGELVPASNPARSRSSVRWPFVADNYPPLAWWRRLPPQAFGDTERLLLVSTIRGIAVLRGGDDLVAAMRGDATAAIDAALGLMPVEEITTPVDITMTALMSIALEGNAAPALVLAQIIGLTDVGHQHTSDLAAAWLAFGERHSDEPDKFGEAGVILLSAFEQYLNKGDA